MKQRTSTFQRWMALLLCVVMFTSLLPVGVAFADDEAAEPVATVEEAAPAEDVAASEEEEPAEAAEEPAAPAEEPAAPAEEEPTAPAEPAEEPAAPVEEPAAPAEPAEEPAAEEAAPAEQEEEIIIDLEKEEAKEKEKDLSLTPPVLKSAAKNGSAIRVSWVAVAGAEKYRVYRKTGSANYTTIGYTTNAYYDDTKVSNGTKYIYTVKAVRGSELSGHDSAGVSATYWNYATPSLKSLTVVDGGMKLTWSSVGSVTYRVFRMRDGLDSNWVALANVSTTSYTDKQVVSGQVYFYTVRVVGNGFQSDYNKTGIKGTYYDKAEISKLENVTGGIKITWPAISGITYFHLERKLASASWNSTATKDLGYKTGTSFVDKDVTSGTEYTYRISAVDRNDEYASVLGTYDATGKSIIFYDTPELTDIEIADGAVTLYWHEVKGAPLYRVFRTQEVDGSGKPTGWKGLANVKTTQYTDKTAAAGTTYYYTVRCMNAAGSAYVSSYDPAGLSTSYTNVPVLIGAVPFDDGTDQGIQVSWKPVEGVKKYQVYRKTANSNWEKPTDANGVVTVSGSPTEITYVDKDPPSYVGTKFTYTVRCLTDGGDDYSAYNPDGVSATYYPKPTGLAAESVPEGINLTWDAVTNAPGYQIFRRATSTGAYKAIGTSTTPTYTDSDSKLTSGTKYEYQVCVLNSDNEVSSAMSSSASDTYYAAPKLLTIEVVTEGIKITWEPEENITSYLVFRKTKNSDWTQLPIATEATYTDTNVTSGTTYSYTVACYRSGKQVSGYDPVGLTETFYGYSPSSDFKMYSAANKTAGIQVSWNAVDGINRYAVYRREKDTQKEAYQKIGESDTTTYLDKSVDTHNGATYYYTVKCMDASGKAVGDYAQELANPITRFQDPVLVSATMKGSLPAGNKGEIVVSWNAVDAASKYVVYRKVNNGSWSRVAEGVTGTSYTDTVAKGLESGKTYTYTVRVWDALGTNWSWYDSKGVGTLFLSTPELLTPERTTSGVLVAWKAVEGASGYRIYRKLTTGTTFAPVKTVSGYGTLTWTDTDVLTGSDYIYTVRAYNGSALSGYNKEGASTQHLNAPVITSVSNAYGGVQVSWSGPSNATSYGIRYRLDGDTWGSWTDVGAKTSTKITGLTSGARYHFQVYASNGTIKSAGSATKSIIYFAAPTNISASRTGWNGDYAVVKVTWTGVTGAENYRVFRKTDGGSWKGLGNTTSTSFTDKTARPNTKYSYTVRCVSKDGSTFVSGFDGTGAAVTIGYQCANPSGISATAATGQVTVKWSKVTGATKYRVFRRTLSGSWQGLGNTTGTSYVDKTASNGTYYYYTVRCISSNGAFWTSSYDSTGVLVLAK